MKNKTVKEHLGLEFIADNSPFQKAFQLLQKEGYGIIDPDIMRRAGAALELQRRMEADAYQQYMSDPASYNCQ